MNSLQLNSTPFAIKDLERIALRLGMCFRILPEDLAVLGRAFPEEVPEVLLENRITSCIAALRWHGLIVPAGSRNGCKYYAVPIEVMQRLEQGRIKQKNLSREEYDSRRKKHHAKLARIFLEGSHAEPPAARLRRLAEGLVQMRRAEEWADLERVFHVSGMHLFGTYDSYIAQACGDLPENVVRQHPSLAIGASMAELSTTVAAEEMRPITGREELANVSFEATASRIDRLIKVHGPQWHQQRTIDGKLFLGLHWMRYHRERGDIDAAREIVEKIVTILPKHAALGDPPSELNLHWFENERGLLEFMAANWPAAYTHLKRTVDLTFESAQPGMYLPRLACSALALQLALTGDRLGSNRLHKKGVSLLDGRSDTQYIEVTLDLSQLILDLDALDLDSAEKSVGRLIKQLYRIEIWGIAVRFVQLFNILVGEQSHIRARLDATRLHGPDTKRISPLNYSQVKQAAAEAEQALGNIQRLRDTYYSDSKLAPSDRLGYARLQFLGQRHERAMRVARSVLTGEATTLRDRAIASALIAAIHVRLQDRISAREATRHCLELSIEAASLLPIALLPQLTRNEIISLAKKDSLWSSLAGAVDIDVFEMERRLAKLGQCFPEEALLVDLTKRERVVLMMLDEEQPQAQIAKRLHVSLSTIKKQVASLYRKLGVRNRKEALACAYDIGFFDSAPLEKKMKNRLDIFDCLIHLVERSIVCWEDC